MEQIKSYLDGELDLAQQAEVETHLRNDADLQKMVEDFREISASLKTADAGEPYGAEKVAERLASVQVAQNDSNKKIWRLAYIWSGAAACLALLTLFFFPVFAQSKAAAKKSSLAFMSQSSMSDGDATADSTSKSESVAQMKASSPSPGNSPSTEHQLDSLKERTKGIGGFQERSKASGKWDAPQDPTTSADGAGSSAGESQPKSDSFVTGAGRAGGQENREQDLSKKAPMFGAGTSETTKGSSDRTTQRFAKSSAPIATPNVPESQFKSGMRQIRDNSVKSDGSNLNDTPHGIYLERSGTISVKVEDLMRSVDETTGMVQSLNGFVVGHELQNEEDGGVATMTVRVPTPSFNAAMNKLQAMGDVISVNSASQDITTPMVESSTSMISWADEEKRLMDELAKAKNNDEKYRIRQQLAQTRVNLNVQRESVKSLKQRSEFSTINITFLRGDKAVKAGGTSNWSGSAFRDAKSGLSSVGQVLGVICIYFLVFCPIWLPFVIAALVIRKKNQS